MDLLQQLKQIPKLERLFLRISEGSYTIHGDHIKGYAEKFEGFPRLKVLVIQDGQFSHPERSDELLKIKGLIHAECKRLQ